MRGARSRIEAAQAAAEAARLRAEQAQAEADRLREQLAQLRADGARRRELIERLQRSRRAEREWNQELRTQLQRVHAARGALAEDADVSELVLRATIQLTDAEKGLLLARTDSDSDGDLDLVHAQGFEDDPEHSAVAQRFAREVLERDRIVRDDAPAGAGDATSADAEIQNLVAIPVYLMDRFHGVVVCANRDGGFEELDDELLLALGDHAGTALQTQRLHNELNESHRAAMRMLADVLEVQDPLLRRQAAEAASLARMLCRRLALEEPEQNVITTAVLLRDVGNVAIPQQILYKPGPLSANERSIVELHPRVGFTLIGELAALSDVASAVLYHHERFDGTGYPMGLAATAIPRAARVVAVVDAYSAIIHDRPHRAARSREQALSELTAGAGTQFDPEIAQLFLEEVRTVSWRDQERIEELPSVLDISGLPGGRADIPASDPLTVLPGHRAFREAAHAAAQKAETDGGNLIVAIVQLDHLEDVNRRDGYVAGDQAILSAARASQLAALRLGGTVYRDSGRRLAIMVTSTPSSAQPDLAAELQMEFAVGPPVLVGVANRRGGESGEDVIRRARAALSTQVVSDNRP